MKDMEIAQLHAGQTAMLNTLCELLISKGLLNRTELLNSFYETLSLAQQQGGGRAVNPLKHIINLIENK